METTTIQTLEFKNELPVKKMEYELIIAEKKEQYKDLVILDISDTKGYIAVDTARKDLKQIRVGVEKFCKSQRDELNRFSKAIIATEKEIIAEIEPLENSLKGMTDKIDAEKAAIRAEKERIEAERLAAIAKAEADRLAKIEMDRIAEIEAAQKAEADRLAALQIEIDKKNKIEQDRLDAIRLEQEIREAEFKAKEAAMLEEQRKIEAEKKAAADAKIKEEEERQRAIELEKAKEFAAQKALEDAEKSRIAAEKEALRLEEIKPDKEKLLALMVKISSTEIPEIKDARLNFIAANVKSMLTDVTNYIKESI